MTSYPPRYQALLEVLEHVMTWNQIPEKIYLNIAFDDLSALPPEIYQSSYSEILLISTTIDLGSCKKLTPTLELETSLPIVTIDDDVLFEPNRIDQLLAEHLLFPKAIIAGRTHFIKRNEHGEISPYMEWEFVQKHVDGPSKEIFPTGVGMILYPKNSLHKDVCNEGLALRYSKFNDDIWHYFQARRVGTQIRQVPERVTAKIIAGTQEVGLWRNGNQTRNDEIIKGFLELYGDPLFYKESNSVLDRFKGLFRSI